MISVSSVGLVLAAPGLARAATCAPYFKSSFPLSEIGARGFYHLSANPSAGVWAAGSPVARWDSTSWSLFPLPYQTRFAIEAIAANDVWAIARDATGKGRNLEHFDGTSWSVTRSAGPLSDLAAVSANDVWAVGGHWSPVTAGYTPNIEHWNGTSWSVVPSPSSTSDLGATSAALSGVTAIAADDAWAIGYRSYGTGLAIQYRPLVEHWDGKRWSVVEVPEPDPSTSFNAVTALATDDVWLVGSAGHRPLIEHWNGISWSVVPSPDPGYGINLRSIAAVSPDDIWAVGYAGDLTLIEHWDGTSWSTVAPGLSKNLNRGAPGSLSALPDGRIMLAAGSVYQLCEIRVGDDTVEPTSVAGMPLGQTLAWGFRSGNSASHSVTDASGMGLFDSGLRAPGGSFTFTFDAAGTYTVVDTPTGRKSTVKVSMTAAPSSGTSATAFALKWAATAAPAGYAYDVQVKRPGSKVYVDYLAGTANASASFTPDAGAGSYGFRSRIRNTVNGKSAGWSSTKTITAT